MARRHGRACGSELSTPEVRTALRLSVVCSLSATALSILLGLPLAWLLARVAFPGRRFLRAAVTLPIVFPPVVGGIALLFAFGRRGLLGQYLYEWFDIRLPFTTPGTIIAETFVAMPFFVITVEAALRTMDRRLEDASRTLRAGRWATFRYVTVPAIRPSLIAGAVLCWARALGEFGATITFAGSFPGKTQTIPLAAYLALERDTDAAIALSLVLLAISVDRPALTARPLVRSGMTCIPTVCTAASRCASGFSTSRSSSTSPKAKPSRSWDRTDPARQRHSRTLAGLLPIDAGRIELDGEVLDDPATEAWLPPEQRRIAVVFQDYLLFPNLSALDNVAFGLRRMGMQKRQARDIAAGWLERFGLTTHADNRPAHLSGGQAQRVALARALATEPRLLLLDEPLAALDAGTRVEMRSDLRRHLTTFPGIGVLVTHDPVDALALADRVVVLEAGRVVQTGTIPDIAAQPRSRYVAELVGVNLLRGYADGTTVTLTTDGGAHDRRTRTRRRLDPHPPHAVALHRSRPDGSPRNTWPGTPAGIDLRDDRVRVRIDGPIPIVAEVTTAAVDALDLEHAATIWVAVKATEIAVYPA